FFYCYAALPALPSFPTRRSSDLDFRYDPKDVITGAADMWAYEHAGVFGWTTEFWSPIPKAGITDYHLIHWFAEHPIADDVALLRSEEHTSELQSRGHLVCRLLLE